jgi:hypothetical protein
MLDEVARVASARRVSDPESQSSYMHHREEIGIAGLYVSDSYRSLFYCKPQTSDVADALFSTILYKAQKPNTAFLVVSPTSSIHVSLTPSPELLSLPQSMPGRHQRVLYPFYRSASAIRTAMDSRASPFGSQYIPFNPSSLMLTLAHTAREVWSRETSLEEWSLIPDVFDRFRGERYCWDIED